MTNKENVVLIQAIREQAYIIAQNEEERRNAQPKASGTITATPVTAVDLAAAPPREQTDARQWAKLVAMGLNTEELLSVIQHESLSHGFGNINHLFYGLKLRDGATYFG